MQLRKREIEEERKEMADLFKKQADNYAEGPLTYQSDKYAEARPTYPPELFTFIASKTPHHDLAWDVGTGNGQAALPLAGIYKKVVATDASQEQLSFAPKLPNIIYHQLPATISLQDLQLHIASQSTLDLITVAQALHWFDLPSFYNIVNFALRPDGVFAAWCYTSPRVDSSIDSVFCRLYNATDPFFAFQKKMVDDEYRSMIEFPFDPVDGMEDTGPVEFMAEREMDLAAYLKYIRSWSAYQTAQEKGVELLTDGVIGEFESAWGGDGKVVKVVKFPIFLRIGKKVGKVE